MCHVFGHQKLQALNTSSNEQRVKAMAKIRKVEKNISSLEKRLKDTNRKKSEAYNTILRLKKQCGEEVHETWSLPKSNYFYLLNYFNFALKTCYMKFTSVVIESWFYYLYLERKLQVKGEFKSSLFSPNNYFFRLVMFFLVSHVHSLHNQMPLGLRDLVGSLWAFLE